MSYRMLLNKKDTKYPIPKMDDIFIVAGVYNSTGDLMQPVVDVHLEPLPPGTYTWNGKEWVKIK